MTHDKIFTKSIKARTPSLYGNESEIFGNKQFIKYTHAVDDDSVSEWLATLLFVIFLANKVCINQEN